MSEVCGHRKVICEEGEPTQVVCIKPKDHEPADIHENDMFGEWQSSPPKKIEIKIED